ncbi:MAG: cysteine synthase A [Bacteroidales bacterium]|nr:cysteine synthase A [Bacteroidales bacterium]
MVYNNILECIGNTPVIRLQHMTTHRHATILVKYEGLNVGGSIKTRVAYNMILQAEKDGKINKNSIIVETSSGNQGIGLALVGAVKGYKTIVIMPDSVSMERRKLMQQYGAEIKLVHDGGDIGECINQCVQLMNEMAEKNPHVYLPQQFENKVNPKTHREQTGMEIIRQVNAPIHGFCAGIGTGGTISGVGATLKEHYPDIEIWAVEPEKAAILSGGAIGSHMQMGIGDGLIPDNLNQSIYNHVCIVSDEEAIATARNLACKEGIVCGISGGTNVAAALQLALQLGPDKTVLTILPDTGERYFSTPLYL